MTPEREKYLTVCGERELQIRVLIRAYKHELKKDKAVCSSYDLKKIGRMPFGYRLSIGNVKQDKIIISALCRELHRLKGMDRVVVPWIIKTGNFPAPKYDCKCGKYLGWGKDIRYCPCCGRRILWEKAK
jgi:hypothetical protein